MYGQQHQNFDNKNNENELNLSVELIEPSPDINKNIIPHIKNDYLLSQINKNLGKRNLKYSESEYNQSNFKNNQNDFQTFLDENINMNDSVNDNSVIFTNSFIQISLIKVNLLRKIFGRKTEKFLKDYFRKWKNINTKNEFISNLMKNDVISRTLQEDLNKISDEIINSNDISSKGGNDIDYLKQNRKVIQDYILNENDNFNFNRDETDQNTNDFFNSWERTGPNYFVKNSDDCPQTNNTKIKEMKMYTNDFIDNENLNKTARNKINNNQVLHEGNINQNYNTNRNLKNQSFNEINFNEIKYPNLNKNSLSMKNIDFGHFKDIDSISILEQNEDKNLSHSVALNENREVKRSLVKTDSQSDLAIKIHVFANRIYSILIQKEKNYAIILLLNLYKKAFKEAGRIHCINTFRLFTKYSIAQIKIKKLQNLSIEKADLVANDDLISKINQLKSERESLIKNNENLIIHFKNECLKLEQNLKEKAMIIFNKNDEIEANREQIEVLNQKNDGYKEQLELVNKKIEKLESKLNNTKLNIIEGN